MKMVKLCYTVKYFLKKRMGIEIADSFFETLITCYYGLFHSSRSGICDKKKRKRKLTVSLTSIPSRMDKLWITIESLLRQTYKSDRIILWLAEDEFGNIELSKKLRKQQLRGLQICYCDNLRSYKKFYDAAKNYPDDYIVTVDDDIIYAEDMLEILVKTYRNNPGNIVCHRSHYIEKRRGELRQYNEWITYNDREKIVDTPSFYNFFTSGAGTLFPVFRLSRELLNKDAFMDLAPYADDVWLNFCAWISGVRTINAKGILGHIITIESSSDNGLARANVLYRRNDEQIRRVLDYLKIDINKYLQ